MADHVISGGSELLAILGDPIEQVRTPALVNAELERRGLDAVLVPLHVHAPDLVAAVAGLRRMHNVRGAVVTMPHKQSVLDLVDEMSPTVREVGACNVIRFDADRTVWGDVTDGHALVTALTDAGASVPGARVFLAGAGGAAAAIAFALAEAGAKAIAVYNRTRARADALARAVHNGHLETAVEATGPDPGGADIVVNATSIGIDPARRELPFDPAGVSADAVVADIVIAHGPTALVTAARAARATVVDGEDMLRAQVEAFVDVMLGVRACNSDRPVGREGGPGHA